MNTVPKELFLNHEVKYKDFSVLEIQFNRFKGMFSISFEESYNEVTYLLMFNSSIKKLCITN